MECELLPSCVWYCRLLTSFVLPCWSCVSFLEIHQWRLRHIWPSVVCCEMEEYSLQWCFMRCDSRAFHYNKWGWGYPFNISNWFGVFFLVFWAEGMKYWWNLMYFLNCESLGILGLVFLWGLWREWFETRKAVWPETFLQPLHDTPLSWIVWTVVIRKRLQNSLSQDMKNLLFKIALRKCKRVEQNIVLLTKSLTQRNVPVYYTQSVLEEAKWVMEVCICI